MDSDIARCVFDDRPADRRCQANWARLILKIYEVDPLVCPNIHFSSIVRNRRAVMMRVLPTFLSTSTSRLSPLTR